MKNIPGFSGYKATKDGRIYSNFSKRFLKPHIRGKYQEVTITKEKQSRYYPVHYLVALAYLPNPENHPQINHIDGSQDLLDNSVENLEWVTSEQNIKHAYENGLIKPYSRRVCQMDLKGVVINIFESQKQAEDETGVDSRAICNVCRKRNKSTGGFYWKYEDDENWTIPSETKRKKVEQIDISTGNVIFIHKNYEEAAKSVNCAPGSMSCAARTPDKKLKGYLWRYFSEIEEEVQDPVQKLHEETREWKIIKDYPDYRISREGLIYSDKRKCIRKSHTSRNGYHSLGLKDKNGVWRSVFVHKLLAEAYIPNPKNCSKVYHLNGDPLDNRIENLKWGTRKDISDQNVLLGKGTRKIVQYEKGKEINRFRSIRQAEKETNIGYRNISRALNKRGKNKKTAGGYEWNYA
jgi:hypothetical protein